MGRDEDYRAIASELEGHVWEAAHDSNANYVLQKLIMVLHQKSIQFIIDELVLRFPGAAACASRDRYACRVIQRLLEFCSPDRVGDLGENLLQDVVGNCQDRYGNMQCSAYLNMALSVSINVSSASCRHTWTFSAVI